MKYVRVSIKNIFDYYNRKFQVEGIELLKKKSFEFNRLL